MLFYKFPYILYRDYPDFGYLTDNRNYGYDTSSKSCIKVGDRILSKSGSVFYSVLTDKPQTVSEISERLLALFSGASLQEVENDAFEFFMELSRDGFVGCCTGKESENRDRFFSYSNLRPYDTKMLSNSLEKPFEIDWGTEYHLSRVQVDISGLCNERCVHCYIPESYRRDVMSRDMFERVLEQCAACKVLNITISGGEPMMNPYLLDFIRMCRAGNFSVNLLSNLTLLTDEMVREFVKTPLLSVQTSLYSMDPKTHDSITNACGSFAKTRRSIEILHEHNIPMHINCPIMKQNKDNYQEVLDWAASLNIDASCDYMLFGRFDGSCKNLQCRLDIPEIEAIIENEKRKGLQIKKEKDVLGNGNPDSPAPICPVCISSICISHLGNVYPCEGWQSFVLGNINDVTLARIWTESSGIQRIRSLSLKDFPKCNSCEDKQYCSICLIRNVNESNSLDCREVNPYFCEIAKIKKRLNKQ